MIFAYDNLKSNTSLCTLVNGNNPLQASCYHSIPEICIANKQQVELKDFSLNNIFVSAIKTRLLRNYFYIISSPHICEDVILYGISRLINKNIINKLRKKRCILILNSAHEHAYKLRFKELEDELLKSGIPLDNVIIVGSNNDFKCIPTSITCCFFNYFETVVRLCYANNQLKKIHDKRIINLKKHNITSRFICLNRIPRDHRCLFVYKLWEANLLKYTLCSLPAIKDYKCISSEPVQFNLPVYETPHNKEFLSNNICTEKYKQFLQILPLTVDIKTEYIDWNSFNEKIVCDAGIYIVTDTLYTFCNNIHDGFVNDFYNEKIFKPIAYKMPFIIVGRPGTLRGLKQMGYKTFSSLWDESYDNIIDPIIRMNTIISVIKNISELPKNKYDELLITAQHIAEYNFLLLRRRRPEEVLLTALNKKQNCFTP